MRLPVNVRGPLAAAVLSLVAACSGGGDGGTGPSDVAPTITVSGVSEGGTFDAPVTVSVSVDRGSYEATLDGQSFTSGTAVVFPGEHVLVVNARSGASTATRTVRFTVRLVGRLLSVRMFNLGDNDSGGGGDALLLTDSSATSIRYGLIDAGPEGLNGANPAYVAQRLQALGVTRLDFVQLTHAHADHYAGLPAVLSSTIPVTRFVYNGQQRALASYESLINSARVRADSVIVPTAVRPLQLGADAATLRVIPPLGQYLANPAADSRELNEGSLGISLERGTFRMFFTGDGEVEANNRWRTSFATFSANLVVLKAGHHGANDAVFDNGLNGNSAWLAHTRPQTVIVSANGRSHPRMNALAAILSIAPKTTYCTSVHGDITVRILDSGQYEVRVQKNAESTCVRGSEATTS